MCSLWMTCDIFIFSPWRRLSSSIHYTLTHALPLLPAAVHFFHGVWPGKSDNARPGIGRTCHRFSFLLSRLNVFYRICSFASPKDPLHAGLVFSLNKLEFRCFSSTYTPSRLFDFQWPPPMFFPISSFASPQHSHSCCLKVAVTYLVSNLLETTGQCCLRRYRCFLIIELY